MSMMKRGIIAGFMALACVAAAPAFADGNDVVGLNITFITKSNASAQDPHLTVQIVDGSGKVLAEGNNVTGNFGKDGIVSIVLDMKSDTISESELESGKVKLAVKPDGADSWSFDYNLAVTTSDDQVKWIRWNGRELSKSKDSLSDTL